MLDQKPLAQLMKIFSEASTKRSRMRRIPISGANRGDIGAMIEYTDNLFKFFASALESKLAVLNENLSIDQTVDAKDIFDGLQDLNSICAVG